MTERGVPRAGRALLGAAVVLACAPLTGCFTLIGGGIGAASRRYEAQPPPPSSLASVPDGERVRVEHVPDGARRRWVEGVKSDADDEEPDCITIKAGRHWECIPPEETGRVEYVADREGNYALEGAAIGFLVDVCVVLVLAAAIDMDFNPGVPTGR